MKLAEVAQKLGCRLEGPPELEIRGVAGIEYAEAGQITFLANRRYFPLLKTTRASAVLIEEGITMERETSLPALAALRSSNPYVDFGKASSFSISRLAMRRGFIQQRLSRKAPGSARARTLGRIVMWRKRQKSGAMRCCIAS